MPTSSSAKNDRPTVAVVVPVFPRTAPFDRALASLAAQTRLPDLVVLLDDGSNPGAEALRKKLPGVTSEVLQVEPGPTGAALNAAIEHLTDHEFVAFLRSGDAYEPPRLERCLEALAPRDKDERGPAVVVTRLTAVDSRGEPLGAEEPRAKWMAALWQPAGSGVGIAEWLGTGNFAGSVSNIFARHEHLAANPFPAQAANFAYAALVVAAVQDLLLVLDEPLLRHHVTDADREFSAKRAADNLLEQIDLMQDLARRIEESPQTRRNFASFHRAAWNNLSGLREDLFLQVLLRLGAVAPLNEARRVANDISRGSDAARVPAHLQLLLEGASALDVPAYASALRAAREDLAALRADNRRLAAVAAEAQGSGWVRFGAWLGERSARRIMEMDPVLPPEPAAPTAAAEAPANDPSGRPEHPVPKLPPRPVGG